MMRFLKCIFLLSLFGFLFAACERTNTDEISVKDPIYVVDTIIVNNIFNALSADGVESMDLGCHELLFPLDLLLESGTIVSIESVDDFMPFFEEDLADPAVDFIYPVYTLDEDGVEYASEDATALALKFANCIPDEGWDHSHEYEDIVPAFLFESNCLELLYPVFLIDLDSTQYIANDESDFLDLVLENEFLFLDVPFSVLFEETQEIVVNDFGQFHDLVALCEGISPPVLNDSLPIIGYGCLDIVYPFTVLVEGNLEVVVEDINEYMILLLEGIPMEIQMPFTLVDEDGILYEINNAIDLADAYEDACGIIIDIHDVCCAPDHALLIYYHGFTNCQYTVNFPVQITFDGGILVINNAGEYHDVFEALMDEDATLVYPVQITLADGSGTVITFNSADEICAFYEDCL